MSLNPPKILQRKKYYTNSKQKYLEEISRLVLQTSQIVLQL